MNQKRLDLNHDMNGSYVTSRILVLKYMFLFLLGISLHTFSISWMRNDHFNEDKYFTAFYKSAFRKFSF